MQRNVHVHEILRGSRSVQLPCLIRANRDVRGQARQPILSCEHCKILAGKQLLERGAVDVAHGLRAGDGKRDQKQCLAHVHDRNVIVTGPRGIAEVADGGWHDGQGETDNADGGPTPSRATMPAP